MARDKKSFILYADQKTIFDSLSDKEAGLLIKHIYSYVNDENPEAKNKIIKIAFEPIKQQLKRDLRYWEEKREKLAEAGKRGGIKSGESRKNEATLKNASINEANEAVTVNANVTVNEIENTAPPPVVDGYWEREARKLRTLSECKNLALADEVWVGSNKTNEAELDIFNKNLTMRGKTEKTLLDYKEHFPNWKAKNPDKLKPNGESKATWDERLKAFKSAK